MKYLSKKIIFSVLIGIIGRLPLTGWAQLKIAVYDIDKNLTQADPEIDMIAKNLNQQFAPEELELQQSIQRWKTHVQDYEKMKDPSTPAGLQLKRNIDEEHAQVMKLSQLHTKNKEAARRRSLNTTFEHIQTVITQIAKRDHYHLVLIKNQAVAYALPEMDITDKIIQRLQKECQEALK